VTSGYAGQHERSGPAGGDGIRRATPPQASTGTSQVTGRQRRSEPAARPAQRSRARPGGTATICLRSQKSLLSYDDETGPDRSEPQTVTDRDHSRSTSTPLQFH